MLHEDRYFSSWDEENDLSPNFVDGKPFGTIYHPKHYITDFQPVKYGGLDYNPNAIQNIELPWSDSNEFNKYYVNPHLPMRLTINGISVTLQGDTARFDPQTGKWQGLEGGIGSPNDNGIFYFTHKYPVLCEDVEDEHYYSCDWPERHGIHHYEETEVVCTMKITFYLDGSFLEISTSDLADKDYPGRYINEFLLAKVQILSIDKKFFKLKEETKSYLFNALYEKAPDNNYNKKDYNIIFDCQGGYMAPYDRYGINLGESYASAMNLFNKYEAEPIKEGYRFVKWYNEKYNYTLSDYNATYAVNEDVTFKAIWEKIQPPEKKKRDGLYRITLNPKDGKLHPEYERQKISYINLTETYFKDPEKFIGYGPKKKGYKFIGWHNDFFNFTISYANCNKDVFSIGEDLSFRLEHIWTEEKEMNINYFPKDLQTLYWKSDELIELARNKTKLLYLVENYNTIKKLVDNFKNENG